MSLTLEAGEVIDLGDRRVQVVTSFCDHRHRIPVRNEKTRRLSYIPEWRLLKAKEKIGTRPTALIERLRDLSKRCDEWMSDDKQGYDAATVLIGTVFTEVEQIAESISLVDYERMRQQAHVIEIILRKHGIGPMPLDSGVLELSRRIEADRWIQLREFVQRSRDREIAMITTADDGLCVEERILREMDRLDK